MSTAAALVVALSCVGADPSVVRVSVIGAPHDTLFKAGDAAPALAHVEPMALGGKPPPTPLELGKGTITVVNFWATWCGPCVQEMPELAKASQRMAGRVRFVGLASADSPTDDIAGVVKRAGVAYDIYRADESAARAWHVFALPSTAIVDGAGVVRWSVIGALDARDFDLALASLLSQKAAAALPGERLRGLGFAIRPDVVVTAADAVRGLEEASPVVVDARGAAHDVSGLIAEDQESGLAFLRVDGAAFSPLALGAAGSAPATALGVTPEPATSLDVEAPLGTVFVDAGGAVVGMKLAAGTIGADHLRAAIARTNLDGGARTYGPDVRGNLIISAIFFGAIAAVVVVALVVGRLRRRPRPQHRRRPTLH